MIDWISVTIRQDHKPIPAGVVYCVTADGEEEWRSARGLSVEGSYSSKIMVRSLCQVTADKAKEIYISGNPSKFLQGHNIFGSPDLESLLVAILERILPNLEIETVPLETLRRARVSRVDFTKSIAFDNESTCRAYIRELALRAASRSGRPKTHGWTVQFQPSSKRWTVVCYHKGDEVKAHKLPKDIPYRERLESESMKLCRVELRLKTLELNRINARRVADLTPERLETLYADYLGRIEMSTNVTLPSEILHALPRPIRSTYLMHREGVDVSTMMSRATYYKHRRQLMAFGVDISIPFDKEHTAEIIPLKRVLTGQPYSAPQWADGTPIYFKATA